MRFSSGSYVPGSQVPPPPCIAVSTDGQLSMPGSPAPGVDHHFHCTSPVSGSRDTRKPRMSIASPPTPTSTWFLTTNGAVVVKYCSRASAICLRQRSFPVLESTQITQSSGPRKYNQLWYIPRPRLPTRCPPSSAQE